MRIHVSAKIDSFNEAEALTPRIEKRQVAEYLALVELQ